MFRKYPKWTNVLPIQNIRQCPECDLLAIGGAATMRHDIKHRTDAANYRMLIDAVRQLAEYVGCTVIEPPEDNDYDDGIVIVERESNGLAGVSGNRHSVVRGGLAGDVVPADEDMGEVD
jgi:hypothetical protein